MKKDYKKPVRSWIYRVFIGILKIIDHRISCSTRRERVQWHQNAYDKSKLGCEEDLSCGTPRVRKHEAAPSDPRPYPRPH